MGIPGLTTFINKHSDIYLQSIDLHNTYLVIDGNSIACQIYSWYAKCNCAFGGDYDKFANSVSEFFNDLLKCNITPLVLIDGGAEEKKLKTILNRTKDKIRTGSGYNPSYQRRIKFFPIFLKEVFKDVLRAKGIKHAQCLFEADNTIAAIARILNCPVLSYDSDFYVYNVMYIPFNTMEKHSIKVAGGHYVKRCKIYRVEKLLRRFKGLDQTMLPLAAILLGNDYVKRSVFNNFFRHMKLPKTGRRKHNEQQCRIEATLAWLSRYNLNQAITEILSRLPRVRRRDVLDKIEMNIEGYTSSSISILPTLGFSKEFVAQIAAQCRNKTFKFKGDINNLYAEEPIEDELEAKEGEEEEEEEMSDIICILKEAQIIDNEAIINDLPVWFIEDFKMGKFPSYFMDLLVRSLYILPIPIEDYFYSSTATVSLKIIGMIYELLRSGIKETWKDLECVYRGEKNNMVRHKLQHSNELFHCKLPALTDLRDLPLVIRRSILNSTLGINDEQFLHNLPPDWILYIATAKYWVQHQHDLTASNCHLYSLLFSMLQNVVDRNVGFFRVMKTFKSRCSEILKTISNKRAAMNYQPFYPSDVKVWQAYQDVDRDDCFLAVPFFISSSEVDVKLFSNTKKFNVTIVHAFSQFQSCLRHSMNLNALLGYPYPQAKVAELFNGTLLYNLYVNFQKRNDAQNYINTVLKDSPSLLRLFNVLLSTVQPLFSAILENKVNHSRRRKNNSGKSKTTVEDVLEGDVEAQGMDESFYDENNMYSMLSSAS